MALQTYHLAGAVDVFWLLGYIRRSKELKESKNRNAFCDIVYRQTGGAIKIVQSCLNILAGKITRINYIGNDYAG
jgi:hypothetical protein